MTKTTTPKQKRADQYDDPNHNYLDYWNGRDYEHNAEMLAIKHFLADKHFKLAVDVGGGYGRLDILLSEFADKVILAEPSKQQLTIAEKYLAGHKNITPRQLQADDLKFKNNEADLVTCIRVMHHLPHPEPELAEMRRILSPDGYAIIEMANYMHAQNRIRHALRGQSFREDPVDIRSAAHRKESEIPFVNHNPHTFMKQLETAGFKIEAILSVSNLRNRTLKKIMPMKAMLVAEKAMQRPLANSFFGPSIFFLLRKA